MDLGRGRGRTLQSPQRHCQEQSYVAFIGMTLSVLTQIIHLRLNTADLFTPLFFGREVESLPLNTRGLGPDRYLDSSILIINPKITIISSLRLRSRPSFRSENSVLSHQTSSKIARLPIDMILRHSQEPCSQA